MRLGKVRFNLLKLAQVKLGKIKIGYLRSS